MFYFAHAHCCSKFTMPLKTTVAIDLEFVAKGKRNNLTFRTIIIFAIGGTPHIDFQANNNT
jgi:hypothetical protein